MLQMKKAITLLLFATLSGLMLMACGNNAASTSEATLEAAKATNVAEAVSAAQTADVPTVPVPTETVASTATLNTDYENAAPVQMQLIIGILQLEGTDQVITTEQATTLLSLLASLKDIAAGSDREQAQIDAIVSEAVSTLMDEQIQAITAMQITQETAMSLMQELGIELGGPQQGAGDPPSGEAGKPPKGVGNPPAGDGGQPPQGNGSPPSVDGAQPPQGDMAQGTPSTDQEQRNTGFIPTELIDAVIEYVQSKTAS